MDVPGRWGGEEFLFICLQTDLKGAAIHAEKLRSQIAMFDFPVVGKKTAGLGVASLKLDETVEELIRRADEALYGAKHN